MGRRCGRGKGCGASCIERLKVCRIELGELSSDVSKVRGEVKSAPLAEPPKPVFEVSSESKQAAAELISKYEKGEKETTSLMTRLAKENGSTLVGLNNRLKTESSLSRKIETIKGEFGGDARKAAESMSDVNRYTMRVPPNRFGNSVKNVLSDLQSQGFSLRIKNYWSPDAGPYRGLNVALTAPDGRKIELQFHTVASLEVKNKTHKDYEEFRISTDNARRREIWDRMVEISKTIPMPRGAMDIGGPDDIKKIEFKLI